MTTPAFDLTTAFNLSRIDIGMTPRVELVEYDDRVVVKADVHAAGETGVAISMVFGILAISSECGRSGTRHPVPDVGSFCYRLSLPDDVDETSVSIEYEGRVLTVTFARLH